MNSKEAGHQPKRCFLSLFFEIPKESSSLTTYKRIKQSQKHIILHFWIVCTKSCERNGRDWRAKKSSFIMTALWLTPPQSLSAKIAWIKVRIATPSTLFSWFSPLWLLPIPKPQDLARETKIIVQWGSHRCYGCEFWRLRDFLLFRGDQKIETHRWTKCADCRAPRRLRRKVKKNFPENM